jgi:hypothetical protein
MQLVQKYYYIFYFTVCHLKLFLKEKSKVQIQGLGKKKNPLNKNQGWDPSIKSTRQMKTQVDTTQRKKNLANNQQNLGKEPMQKGFMAMK